MPAKFVIEQRDKYFLFTFYGDCENVILFSRLFRNEELCNTGIRDVIAAIANRDNLQKLNSNARQFSFVIRNKKGVTIGHSPVYFAQSTCDYAIRQLEFQAPHAIIDRPEFKRRVTRPGYEVWKS